MTDAPRRAPTVVLAAVCTAIFLGALDLTVVTAILPRVLVDLDVSIDTDLGRASWAITGYLLAYTIGMLLAGRLSDLYGRARCYLAGLLLFLAGSALAALAPTLDLLIVGRMVQAIGAGGLVPIAMALAGDLLPEQARAQAIGVIAAVDTAGWMVGHLYGGALMRLFDDWRLIFWLNIPLGAVALAITMRGLRVIPAARPEGRFDWRGALLVSGALAALQIGLGGGAELGAADFYGERGGAPLYTLPLILGALALLGLFVRVERRVADPLIDLDLLGDQSAIATSVLNLLIGFALAIALAAVPLLINTRVGLARMADPDALRDGAWDSGLLLSALTLTMALTAWPGGRLAGRVGPHTPAIFGMVLALAGFLTCATWRAQTGYLEMSYGLALAGAGLGLALAPAVDVLIGVFGVARRGVGAALAMVLRLIGMTLGVSTLTIWGVQRQDTLRRLGASDPLASSDPAAFLTAVVAQVVSEAFLFAAAACLVAVAAAWRLTDRRRTSARQNRVH
jgi:MFS family permease